MFKEKFYQNVSMIEKSLFGSKSFEYIKETGLEKEAIASLVGEIFKQSIQGALSLQELEIKQKIEELNYTKLQSEIELAILQMKAQVKVARAEALKSLIQAKSMIRSVSDNAAINKANAYVGLGNVCANATEINALTGGSIKTDSVSAEGETSLALLAALNIEKINSDKITDFDEILPDLINAEDNFGCKDVLIHTPNLVIAKGDYTQIIGISSYGENETQFLVNGEVVASNVRNYLFEGLELGEFIVQFRVKNDDGDFVSDSLTLKVVEPSLNDDLMALKKF